MSEQLADTVLETSVADAGADVDKIFSDIQSLNERPEFREIVVKNDLEDEEHLEGSSSIGLAMLVRKLLEKQDVNPGSVSKKTVEDLIAELDSIISSQVDEIIHHPEFQKMESAWRELNFLLERTDFSENISVEIISISKDELKQDFEDNVEIIESGLYKKVYTDEFGQYGGKPFAAILGAYRFDKSAEDMKLLSNVASVSAMSHSPFISSIDSKFFGLNSFEELENIRDFESEMEGSRYRHWNSFRESDDSRNVGLCMPRFLLREPYSRENPIKSFQYNETTEGFNANYLWGNAAFAFSTRIVESFAKYRWCPNIIGPQSGGAVEDLPIELRVKSGLEFRKGPTESLVSDRQEYMLSELGFIPLTVRKGAEKACFFSASSTQKAKYFGNDPEDKVKEVNYKLGGQLPYLFVVNRLAHYLKVLQRENLGSWKSRKEIEEELNKWIRSYVSDQENPSPSIRSQRPLRHAKISVTSDMELGAGWYKVDLAVTPHFKYMGASFTLSLASKIEGEDE